LTLPLPEPAWRISENGLQGSLIGIGILVLLAIGLTPHWIIPYLTNMAILLSSPFP